MASHVVAVKDTFLLEGLSGYNRYWQFQHDSMNNKRDMLEKVKLLGYNNVKVSFSKVDLCKYMSRPDRGLLCYEHCTDEELRAFAIARNVRCHIPGKRPPVEGDRRRTIETLMYDDDHPLFTRFLELPPELRNCIYELYDGHSDATLINPVKPPLAQACRQLMQEVLPIFYYNHEFVLEIVRNMAGVFREKNKTSMWLSQLSSDDAANIQRLRLVVSDTFRKGYSARANGVAGTVCLRLEHDSTSRSIEVEQCRNGALYKQWDKNIMERLHEEVTEILDRLHSGGAKEKFKLQDVHDLRKAITAAYIPLD